jgi:hypothetical protein
MTTTTAESTTAADATAPEVIEGEIVEGTEGPATTEAAAGEEKSSETEVARRATKEPETSDLTEKEARKLADRIKRSLTGAADVQDRLTKIVGDTYDLMTEAYTKKIHLALGQSSWEDFVNGELGEVRVRLERSVRAELSYRMKYEAHMSTRAIAPVFGVDQKTVSNDVNFVKRERGVPEGSTKVVGTDGKEQDATPRPRKQKPVEDRFEVAIDKADKLVGDLVALSTEEGFAEAAGSIAKTHRATIARLLDSLKGVQDRLQ